MAKQQKIDDIIRMAVEAGRIAAQSEAKDAYKATERRLYALPVLRKKVKNDREKLMEYITYGIPEKSKSITRFMRSGVRLSTTDIAEALKQDLEATIAADEYEVSVVEEALKSIESDQYYMAVTEKYLDNKSDDEVAEKLYCDPSTVRWNRSRLVRKRDLGGYGNVVVIEDSDGLVTKYAHCNTLFVSAGQTVTAGDTIATVGSTGDSTGPHLHFEVLKDGQYLNPAYFALTSSY